MELFTNYETQKTPSFSRACLKAGCRKQPVFEGFCPEIKRCSQPAGGVLQLPDTGNVADSSVFHDDSTTTLGP
jgi:hypothetical protein